MQVALQVHVKVLVDLRGWVWEETRERDKHGSGWGEEASGETQSFLSTGIPETEARRMSHGCSAQGVFSSLFIVYTFPKH
jgi:hypothetical protein